MAGNKERHFKNVPRWQIALNLAARLHAFPDDYFGSRWYDWEKRIKDGHNAEENRINKLHEKELKRSSSVDPYIADVLGEECSNNLELTNNMYAALIVSIWSEIEHFLKDIVRACYVSRNEQKNVPDRIEKIIKTIEEETGIQIYKCDCYTIINAARILNNSFKHSNGRYKHEPSKTYKQIEKSLLKKWEIKEGQKINYTKLPIQDIVLACNGFCTDLQNKIKAALTNRPEITQREPIGHGG